jgi:hypothetical protein
MVSSASFIAALGALASTPFAFAQYYPQGNATVSGPYPTGTGSPSSNGSVVVTVGKDGQLRFVPDIVEAAVGSEIAFEFYPKNRSYSLAGAIFDLLTLYRHLRIPSYSLPSAIRVIHLAMMPSSQDLFL